MSREGCAFGWDWLISQGTVQQEVSRREEADLHDHDAQEIQGRAGQVVAEARAGCTEQLQYGEERNHVRILEKYSTFLAPIVPTNFPKHSHVYMTFDGRLVHSFHVLINFNKEKLLATSNIVF